MSKKWIEINGSVETNLTNEEFTYEFTDWLESKGWSFVGLTREMEEEKDLKLEIESIRIELLNTIEKNGLMKKFVAKELGLNYNNFITFLTGSRNDSYATEERLKNFKDFIERY